MSIIDLILWLLGLEGDPPPTTDDDKKGSLEPGG
jgi:hypothetical protein